MRHVGMGIIAALAATACSSLPSELEPFDGTFSYAAFGDDGTPVLSGTLRLNVMSDGSVAGTWEIERVPGADPQPVVGPQVGAGDLVGMVADGELALDLNPGVSDNNVGLFGTFEGGTIVGTWSYETLTGPRAGGGFSAAKIR